MNHKLWVSLIIGFLVLVFILQNTEVVKIQFLFWSLSMSRSLLAVLLVVVGMVIGWLLSGYLTFKNKRKDRSV